MPLVFELGEEFQFDWSEEALVLGGIIYTYTQPTIEKSASNPGSKFGRHVE